jgi:hypothetical protein
MNWLQNKSKNFCQQNNEVKSIGIQIFSTKLTNYPEFGEF